MGIIKQALNSYNKRMEMIRCSELPQELQSALIDRITEDYEGTIEHI